MLVCMDLDGTIDADPQLFQTLAAALRAAGCQVAVLTGLHGTAVISPADVQEKKDRLEQLGFSAYDHLAVFPDDGAIPQLKAAWIKQHGADCLIDNSRANAQAAQDLCTVLVPWQTRLGKAKDGKAQKSIRVVDLPSQEGEGR